MKEDDEITPEIKSIANIRPIKPGKIQDARRIISRVLYWLQTGEIDQQLAKTIAYIAKLYTEISTSSDLEKDVEYLMNKAKESENKQKQNERSGFFIEEQSA